MPEILAATEKLGGFPQDQYFSANMQHGQFGLASLLSNPSLADSSSISGLTDIQVFADGAINNPAGVGGFLADAFQSVFGQGTDGTIYTRRTDQDTWTELYKPVEVFTGAGMILGDDSSLYYVGDRYLGQGQPYSPYTTTGTISVTNGSAAVVGSGTLFVAGNVGQRIKIGGVWYSIATVTDFTHITISPVFAGSTASGLSYTLYVQWIDKFQDFGSSLSGGNAYNWAQPFNFEGDLLIPRKNKLCRYNADGSFNNESSYAFSLPSSMYIRCASGGTNKILLGAEIFKSSRSYLVLWDNFSVRSIAPWIPLKSKVQAIKPYGSGWLVVTQREILFTDGYTVRVVSEGIDPRLGENSFSTTPYGLEVIGDRAIIANQIGGYTRKRSGVYIFSLSSTNTTQFVNYPTTGSYQYLSPLGIYSYNATPYAIFLDTAQRLNLSVETVLPAKKYLTLIKDAAPTTACVISNPLMATGDRKNMVGVKVDMATLEGGESITADVTVKVAALNRRLWGVQQAKIAGVSTSQITVDGTLLGDVSVGDEIVIMEGANAGLTRHVSSITGAGTTTEVWTLDVALTANIEQNAYINITPFKLVSKKSVTTATSLRDMYFDVQNNFKGKQFLVKVVLSNLSVPIEILTIGVVADDKGNRS